MRRLLGVRAQDAQATDEDRQLGSAQGQQVRAVQQQVLGREAVALAEVVAEPVGGRLHVSPWRFRDHPGSKAERFEDPVIDFGYRKVGQAYGLRPQFVTSPTTLALGECPAIVWIEAAHGIAAVAPETILRHAQLSASRPSPGAGRADAEWRGASHFARGSSTASPMTTTSPRIAVLLPCYNEEAAIARP